MSQKDARNLDFAIELNREEFDESTIKTLKKMFQSNSKTIVGHLAISENFNDEKMASFFDTLTYAIENRYYLKLSFIYGTPLVCEDVKPIKIVYLDNNWYIAFEYFDTEKKEKIFRFGRLSFIKEIQFLKDNKYSDKTKFQIKDMEIYINYLHEVQNSMTLFDKPKKIATLKAAPVISRYFKKGMKTFLHSQQYLEEQSDGSILFTLEYTQPLEILPLIQKWMPDLIILEPKELKDAYTKKLTQTINNHK